LTPWKAAYVQQLFHWTKRPIITRRQIFIKKNIYIFKKNVTHFLWRKNRFSPVSVCIGIAGFYIRVVNFVVYNGGFLTVVLQ
jgi:hypothetical protein